MPSISELRGFPHVRETEGAHHGARKLFAVDVAHVWMSWFHIAICSAQLALEWVWLWRIEHSLL